MKFRFPLDARGRLSLVLALLFGIGVARGQTEPGIAVEAAIPDLTEVESLRARVEADSNLDEATKTKALEFYTRALAAIEQKIQTSSRDAALTNRIESAVQLREDLQRSLETPDTEAQTVELPEGADSAEIRALTTKKRAELGRARGVFLTLSQELARLKASATVLDDRLAALQTEIAAVESSLKLGGDSAQTDALHRAQQVFLRAQRAALRSESRLTWRQLSNFDLLVSLAALEREVAQRKVGRIESALEQLAKALGEQSVREAARARQRAEATLAVTTMLPPPMAALAQRNVELRLELEAISEKTNKTGRVRNDTEKLYAGVQQDLETTRVRVEALGASPAVGRLLRRRLDRLPSASDFRRSSWERQREIAAVTDRRIDVEELPSEFPDIDQQVDALIAGVSTEDLLVEEAWLREQARELTTAQLDTIRDLAPAYRVYLTQLVALDVMEQELAATVEEAVQFIRRELIWIRDLEPLRLADFQETPQALGTLFAPERWRRALTDAKEALVEHPLGSALGLSMIALCFLVRRRSPVALAELGAKTRQIRTDSFTHTLQALAYTLIAASAWPLAIAYCGWLLDSTPRADFSAALGAGLLGFSTFLFSVAVVRWILHPEGLARIHFRWPDSVAESLSRELRWLAVASWVVVPVVGLSTKLGEANITGAVGRPLLILGLAILALFIWRSLGPSSPFSAHFARDHGDTWITRLRLLWFPVIVGAPIALAVAAAAGYQYTAQIMSRLFAQETVWFLGGLLVLRASLLRWFFLSERRLRLESAIRHREEARQEREQEEKSETEVFDIEIPEPNYKELGEQARALVRIGVFFGVIASLIALWGEFLPFYAFLESITLPYARVKLVEGVEQQVPATLGDLGVGLLLIVATVLAVRNLPGLLEFTVLRYFRIDAGARYAMLTLFQYGIVAIGVIASLSTIGMEWQKLQWLVAALGVGLGFGLQEIVANFVSGIILLIERPIRIGDVVTVGDASGAVSRIQIRATTILTYDSQELLVPNKEFITGRLLNWTLTDQITRIVINVGVAYGSDVEKALKLILDAAVEEEQVLEDPTPSVNFEGFGDNALDLSLRAYVGSLDSRLTIQTALHKSIYAKLNDAGIEIAFPQRDVHLDAGEPLQVRVLGRDAEGRETT